MKKFKTFRKLTPRQELIAWIRWQEIRVALKYFNGQCMCCGKSIITNRIRPKPHTLLSFVGFLYHHTVYVPGEPRRKNYPQGTQGTWLYKKAVMPIVEERPEEFLLFCNGCHGLIEDIYIKCKNHPERLAAIMLAVKLTRT